MEFAAALLVDLKTLSGTRDDVVGADLREAFGDPLFENLEMIAVDLREFAYTYQMAADAFMATPVAGVGGFRTNASSAPLPRVSNSFTLELSISATIT